MEYLNLYDKSGNLVNKIGIRGKKTDYLKGIVLVFIQNSKGEFLIQKTSISRNNDFSTTGGHVCYGSTFEETVIKEVKEELGIDISKDNFSEVYTYIEDCYFQKVYYLKKDIEIEDIKIQKDEVEYVKWMNIETINFLIKNNQFREGNIKGYQYILDNYKKHNKFSLDSYSNSEESKTVIGGK